LSTNVASLTSSLVGLTAATIFNHTSQFRGITQIRADTTALKQLMLVSQYNHTTQFDEQRSAKQRLVALENTVTQKATKTELISLAGDVSVLEQNQTTLRSRINATEYDIVTLTSHAFDQKEQHLMLKTTEDTRYEESVVNHSKTFGQFTELSRNISKFQQQTEAAAKFMETAVRNDLENFTRIVSMNFTSVRENSRALKQTIQRVNASVTQLKTTLQNEFNASLSKMESLQVVSDSILHDRIINLENVLTPLVYLVTHMVASIQPVQSNAVTVLNTTTTLNVSGGRQFDRVALVLNTSTCAFAQKSNSAIINADGLAVVTHTRVGYFRTCYAINSPSSSGLRFWDQGLLETLHVVEADLTSLFPINASASTLVSSSTYVFQVQPASTVGWIAFVPIVEAGCTSALSRKVAIGNNAAVDIGRTSPGNYVVCYSPGSSERSHQFRRQPLELKFEGTTLQFDILQSGNSYVVAGVSSHVFVSGTSGVTYLSFVDSNAIGCTGAVAHKTVLDNGIAVNVVLGLIAGTTMKACYTTSSTALNDYEFIDTSLTLPINANTLVSLAVQNAVPTKIVANVSNVSLAVHTSSSDSLQGHRLAIVPLSSIGCGESNALNSSLYGIGSNEVATLGAMLNVVGTMKVCYSRSGNSIDSFYNQGLTLQVVEPVLSTVVLVSQANAVVGTNATFAFRVADSILASVYVGLSPLGSGCLNANVTAQPLNSYNNATLRLPSTAGDYSVCVSTVNSGTYDNDYLQHADLVSLVPARVEVIGVINATSGTIVPQNEAVFGTVNAIVAEGTRASFLLNEVLGCMNAHASSVAVASSGLISIPAATMQAGTYKICVSTDGSPVDDYSYDSQTAVFTVRPPRVTSLTIQNAHPNQVVGGVENKYELGGGSSGVVAVMPYNTIGCSSLERVGLMNSQNVVSFTLPLGVTGQYKLCHSNALSDHSSVFSYVDQQVTITVVPNRVAALTTSFADANVVVASSHSYMLVSGTNIDAQDKIALVQGVDGCQGASTSAMAVATVSAALRIEFPSNGYNAGSYHICHFDHGSALTGNDDTHFVRQTSTLLVSSPTLTTVAVLNAVATAFVGGTDVRFKVMGTSALQRVAVLSAAAKGCTGAAVAASTVSSDSEVFFSSMSIGDCTPTAAQPCALKVCHSITSSGGDDAAFADQGANTLQMVAPTVHGTLYVNKGSCSNCEKAHLVYVASAGTYLSVGNDATSGCDGAGSSSYKTAALTCTDASKTHCVHSWVSSALPTNPAITSRSICHASSATSGGTDTDYVQQKIPFNVLYQIHQNRPASLRTTGGPRVKTMHAGRSDGYLYVVMADGSSDGVVKFAKFDGSDQGNVLDETENLNQPWGFVTDNDHLYVSENGNNQIRQYPKTYVGSTPTATGDQKVTWTDVCEIGNPRSLDIDVSNGAALYYICSDGSKSELRRIDTTQPSGTGTDSRLGNTWSGEIIDISILGNYAYVARGVSGIDRVVLSTGAVSGGLMTGFETQYVMSLAVADDRVFFVDYEHNIEYMGVEYMGVYELDLSTASVGGTTFGANPLGLVDCTTLDKDAGTRFSDIYLAANPNGLELYLQQSWLPVDANSDYESAIARVKQVPV
jgi:hypothetical protein